MERFAPALSGQVGMAGQIPCRRRPWSPPRRPSSGWCGGPAQRSHGGREIIALLDLTATTVTADALHGNRVTATAIRERVLPVPGWAETYRFPGLAAMARIAILRRTGNTIERQTRYIALSRLLESAEALRVVRA